MIYFGSIELMIHYEPIIISALISGWRALAILSSSREINDFFNTYVKRTIFIFFHILPKQISVLTSPTLTQGFDLPSQLRRIKPKFLEKSRVHIMVYLELRSWLSHDCISCKKTKIQFHKASFLLSLKQTLSNFFVSARSLVTKWNSYSMIHSFSENSSIILIFLEVKYKSITVAKTKAASKM